MSDDRTLAYNALGNIGGVGFLRDSIWSAVTIYFNSKMYFLFGL